MGLCLDTGDDRPTPSSPRSSRGPKRSTASVGGAICRSPDWAGTRCTTASETGVCCKLHPGVYALGHRAIVREAYYLAAPFWCGGRRRSGCSRPPSARAGSSKTPTDSVPSTRSRCGTARPPWSARPPHRRLQLADVDRFGPLWVTSDARTLVDLADVLSYPELRAVADRLRHSPSRRSAPRRSESPAARRAPRSPAPRRGRGAHALGARASIGRLFRPLRIPAPLRNEQVHGIRVDCWFPQAPLAVELDSRKHHRSEARCGSTVSATARSATPHRHDAPHVARPRAGRPAGRAGHPPAASVSLTCLSPLRSPRRA